MVLKLGQTVLMRKSSLVKLSLEIRVLILNIFDCEMVWVIFIFGKMDWFSSKFNTKKNNNFFSKNRPLNFFFTRKDEH